MTTKYLHDALSPVPQTEPAKPNQVQNFAGGYSFQLDDWARLDRFLILGSEGGTYYCREQKLTRENAQCVSRLIKASGPALVKRIVEISDAGRAPKNDPAIFALALALAEGDAATKAAVITALPKVCRIGTHLYHFVAFARAMGVKWRRPLRRMLGEWFNEKDTGKLAYQLVKYQSRDGWSARDILNLAHPRPRTADHAALYRWATYGYDETASQGMILAPLVEAFEELKTATDEKRVCRLIVQYNLPRECVPTHWLTKPAVWEALLQKMPIGALVRNLGNLTKVGVVAPLSAGTALVTQALSNAEAIRKSRLHPLAVLAATNVYRQGRGDKGSGVWTPVQPVLDALDSAFYSSFAAVQPTGKVTLLGIDVSGSMEGPEIHGLKGISPRLASAAMALVTAAVEPRCHIMGFSHKFVELPISANMRLDMVVHLLQHTPMGGGTDCAWPMLWAKGNLKAGVESMAVYTDNETYYGGVHPFEALKQYRQASGIAARSAVVGMTATGFTIADPNDAGMLDFVGFDSSAPALMADFFRGGAAAGLADSEEE